MEPGRGLYVHSASVSARRFLELLKVQRIRWSHFGSRRVFQQKPPCAKGPWGFLWPCLPCFLFPSRQGGSVGSCAHAGADRQTWNHPRGLQVGVRFLRVPSRLGKRKPKRQAQIPPILTYQAIPPQTRLCYTVKKERFLRSGASG